MVGQTKCTNCGAHLSPNETFCNTCGTMVSNSPLVRSPQNQSPPPTMLYQPNMGGGSNTELHFSTGRVETLVSSSIELGRDPGCEVPFDDTDRSISRHHAWLRKDANGLWVIEDQNSSNGTFVNQVRVISPQILKSGDLIQLGSSSTSFTFVDKVSQARDIVASAPPYHPLIQNIPQQIDLVAQPSTDIIPSPKGGWRQTWGIMKAAPVIQGQVDYISEQYMMKKDDILKRGCLSVFLGWISPALAWLPMMYGNEISARDLRVTAYDSLEQFDIKIIGDLVGNITLGDLVAIWGIDQKGVIIMNAAYNYNTRSEISLRKK